MDQPDTIVHLHATVAVADADNAGHICSNETVSDFAVAATVKTELETLKQAVLDKDQRLLLLQNACRRETERQAELEDSVIAWQDKYDRLYDSHKRVQIVNQSLEDKLLKMVDRNTGERAQLTSDVATLSVRLAQANFNIAKLQREIERYKADMSLAVQLLQCKPESFMPQRISSLPIDVQSKVSAYMRLETNSHSDSEGSGVGVATSLAYKVLPASESPPPAPCPFPPTAMVYSMRGLDGNSEAASSQHSSNNNISNNKKNAENPKDNLSNTSDRSNTFNGKSSSTNQNQNMQQNANSANLISADADLISPLMMAKFLEDELKADELKHCETCQCTKHDLTVLADVSRFYTIGTQTTAQQGNGVGSAINDPYSSGQLCMRCHSNLNSPSRTNSPYLTKVVKSSDSVISETKSSVSDLNDVDKLFTPPPKKDDLMVNPILGHHRLCDRTAAVHAVRGNSDSKPATLKSSPATTLLYPTTHLGTYETEKYLLETNTQASSLKGPLKLYPHSQLSNYQRRFLDGGGSALELLTGNANANTNTNAHGKQTTVMQNHSNGLVDEAKPLLREEVAAVSQNFAMPPDEKALGATLQEPLKSPMSTCSASDVHNKLAKTAITGSTNSLWSRGSNCESAKVFENFNRNLIRAIKSENPKFRGPRLCAMRIQRTETGQSNILLDNIESLETVQPVIYKRRERLLDEELDDTKDIITSSATAMLPEDDGTDLLVIAKERAYEAAAVVDQMENDSNLYVNDAWASQDKESGTAEVLPALATKPLDSLDLLPSNNSTLGTSNNADKVMQATEAAPIEDCSEGDAKAVICSKPNSKRTTSSYEVIRNSLSGKSCTHSSSASEAIDLQESALLRRQQLSRVAEWVQSNTKQFEEQQCQEANNATQSHCESSGTDRQSSFSTLDQLDSVSIEKLSMDSGYKTTPQAPANAAPANQIDICGNGNFEKQLTEQIHSPKTSAQFGDDNGNNGHSKLESTTTNAIAQNTSQRTILRSSLKCELNGNAVDANCIAMLPEQPTCDILNYKYYPCERDKSRAIEAELHMTSTNVDIAQMEYNVKQFLLKQNEWSMRGGGRAYPPNATAASTAAAVASVITASQRPKGIRRSKLFSGMGVGPGVGERVHTEVPAKASAHHLRSESDAANAAGVVTNFTMNPASITIQPTSTLRTTIPQRTETNL